MKKLFLFITLSIFCSTNLFSQKIDLGFQASIPSYGISLKAGVIHAIDSVVMPSRNI